MTGKFSNKGDQQHHHSLRQIKRSSDFDIFNYTGEYISFVKLKDNLGNVSHAVTMSGVWIFITNKKIDTPLIIEYLALICVSHSD